MDSIERLHPKMNSSIELGLACAAIITIVAYSACDERVKDLESYPDRKTRDERTFRILFSECYRRVGRLPSSNQGFQGLLGHGGFPRLIDAVPKDPWGRDYSYSYVSGEITVRSAGHDIQSTVDDWVFRYSLEDLK